MANHVTVAFADGSEYEFVLSGEDLAAWTKTSAREWMAGEFEDLECTPSNPVGKVLVLDMILNVAKYGGERRFADDAGWAEKFAATAAVLLERPAIRVDVANFVVG